MTNGFGVFILSILSQNPKHLEGLIIVKAFKVCPKCEYAWITMEAFLNDASIRLVGFQASFNPNDRGLYLFNHIIPDNRCNTTLAVEVETFMSLYDGPMYEEIQVGSEMCGGYCATVDDLEQCSSHCRNASARELMLKLFRAN